VVSLNEQKEKSRYVLHALYATPIKRGSGSGSVEVIEDLLPVCDTKFSIKIDKEVKSVVLVPQNENVDFAYGNGVLNFTIKQFTCKQVVVINY
jgi:hypothetical protein